jgi:hypothetical protein
MLKSDQAACQFAHDSLLMARLLATRSRRTTSRKNHCVRDRREGWVSFTVPTDTEVQELVARYFNCLPPAAPIPPPDAGLFRLTCASHGAFEGFFIPCPGFGGSSVLSVETSFPTEFLLLAFGPRLDLVGGSPRRNEVALQQLNSPFAKFQVVLLQAANVRVSHHHPTGVVVVISVVTLETIRGIREGPVFAGPGADLPMS